MQLIETYIDIRDLEQDILLVWFVYTTNEWCLGTLKLSSCYHHESRWKEDIENRNLCLTRETLSNETN